MIEDNNRKIIIFSHYYYPFFGGIQRFIKSRIDCINSDTVTLITSEPEPKRISNQKVSIRKINYSKSNRFKQVFSSFLSLFIECYNKNTIQIECSSLFPGGLCASIIKTIFFSKNIKIYIFIHGDEILKAENSLLTKYIYKFILLKTDKIIANSLLTKKIFKKFFRKVPKIKIINPPPSIEFLLNSKKKRIQNIPVKKTKLISVCRLVKKKNITNVIKAINVLINAKYSLTYQICGTGPELKNLKKLTKELKLDNTVKFYENISDLELVNKYSESDIFIMPTVTSFEKNEIEGFGIVFLEALVNALVVLYPQNSGSEDLKKYSDLLIPINSENTDSIIKSIQEAIRKSKSKKLRQISKQTSIKKVENLYLELSRRSL